MVLYDDYLEYTNKYKKIYGNKSVVLMEVGSFFELYAVDKDEGAPIYEICSLLNIQYTRKNKSILECSKNNPLMAGFPSSSLKKFMDVLIQEQYTVILVEQVTPPPVIERKVTQIISPSTYLDTYTQSDTRNLLCVYLSNGYDRVKKEEYVCLTYSYTDITRGTIGVLQEEYCGDITILLQEATKLVNVYSPREMVWISDVSISELIREECRKWFSIQCVCIHDRLSQSIRSFQQLSYQNTLLQKVYVDTGMLSPIEFVELEKNTNALISFVYLLQFVYEHNENMITKLQRPVHIKSSHHLQITNTSLEQLNIINKPGTESSILKLLNTCQTPMGKRFFKECLVSPLTNPNTIQERYDWIEKLQVKNKWNEVKTMLSSIKDIERLYRKMNMNVLQPSEMAILMTSLESVYKVSCYCEKEDLPLPYWSKTNETSLVEWMTILSNWDKEIMSTCSTTHWNNFYKNNEKLTFINNRLHEIHNLFKNVLDEANKYCEEDWFKMDIIDNEYQFTITKRRYDMYHRKKRGPVFEIQPFPSKPMYRLYFSDMKQLQFEYSQLIIELQEELKLCYETDTKRFSVYDSLLSSIITFISNVDVWSTCAKNAIQFHYTRPLIKEEEHSMLSTKALRHPLIETILQDIAYVPNDIDLGGTDTHPSILLHGINAIGKSSLMKSIGISIILAQSGMYVPADYFEYSPYRQIFTRIPGGDNLFKGQSTFVSEMADVRTIMKYGNAHSLIIGDELCAGTESISALSIVAAGVVSLSNKNASFIFATHLHEVSTLECIHALSNVKICHMSVHYDEITQQLVYDRILRNGPGETIYGLEVCKSLDLPIEFLHLANTIRQSYLDINLVRDKKSKYSSHKYIDICSLCHKPAKEIHHIKEQHKADHNGFIGVLHKNHPSNLIAVCDVCHDKIHDEVITVNGYQSTSNGIKLSVTHTPIPELVQNEFDMYKSNIQTLRKEGNSISKIASLLNLSTYKVNKFIAMIKK